MAPTIGEPRSVAADIRSDVRRNGTRCQERCDGLKLGAFDPGLVSVFFISREGEGAKASRPVVVRTNDHPYS